MLNPTVQDSQPTTEDMQWWKNQTGFCLCCSRSSGRRYLVRESCLIHRLDLWPHVIFLPFQGELFLYQMREPGEFSINMCSGLISPPMSSSSSDWSILHTHRNRVCVCVCVCVRGCAHAQSPLMSSPLGPLQELVPLRMHPPTLCSRLLWDGFFLKSSYITPEINPIYTDSLTVPASMLTSITISGFLILRVCVCVYAWVPSCSTLSDPMNYSPPGPSVHGILQSRILECVAISSSRGFSQPRDQTLLSCVSCIGKQILNHHATWEALDFTYLPLKTNLHEN